MGEILSMFSCLNSESIFTQAVSKIRDEKLKLQGESDCPVKQDRRASVLKSCTSRLEKQTGLSILSVM